MVLSEESEDKGCWACRQVVYDAECEGAKHGCDNWRKNESRYEDAEEERLLKNQPLRSWNG